ncbi:HypC/HybG/HupF family hydrogenase formation chaperone [Acidocella aromatica]|uniref:Hydrogenase expression/formation protein HypC n=1 Tax=Acidocella aromatica TaxID=1303579 RepID=A0A840VQ61_9PROT|nr:HypC/HybG/HupF family hydrogenase formation chaperone [Acidocella aromatica]MBB5373540.1 hydrogenase expression/formation protein HypC [Acidocella aromatica]
MCLGIPMQVVAIDGFNAECEARGVKRNVSLFMIGENEVEVCDYVMVHVGYALRKMTPEDARLSWELFDEILAVAGE